MIGVFVWIILDCFVSDLILFNKIFKSLNCLAEFLHQVVCLPSVTFKGWGKANIIKT